MQRSTAVMQSYGIPSHDNIEYSEIEIGYFVQVIHVFSLDFIFFVLFQRSILKG